MAPVSPQSSGWGWWGHGAPLPSPLCAPPKHLGTHISLLAEGLGQSCVGSVASMISLKRVFPTLTASCGERGRGRRALGTEGPPPLPKILAGLALGCPIPIVEGWRGESTGSSQHLATPHLPQG